LLSVIVIYYKMKGKRQQTIFLSAPQNDQSSEVDMVCCWHFRLSKERIKHILHPSFRYAGCSTHSHPQTSICKSKKIIAPKFWGDGSNFFLFRYLCSQDYLHHNISERFHHINTRDLMSSARSESSVLVSVSIQLDVQVSVIADNLKCS
jgi:hypothetical protein